MAPLQKERIDNGGIFNPSQQCVCGGEKQKKKKKGGGRLRLAWFTISWFSRPNFGDDRK